MRQIKVILYEFRGHIGAIILMSIGIVVSSEVFNTAQKAEKVRLNKPVITYIVQCRDVPPSRVSGDHVSSNIVGSDMIHVLLKNEVVGMYPEHCTLTKEQ